MEKQITLQNRKINYVLRRSRRARRVRLAVRRDGTVVLTVPFYLVESVAEGFIREKAKWLLSKIAYFKQFKIIPVSRFSRVNYLKNKEEASKLVKERVNYFNKTYKYSFNRISVKNQKTRWGSCSKKGNLNFNYKILFLSEKLQDYIIVHELCHLKELNHSSKFWDLVAKTFPDYREVKAELQKRSMTLQ